jgi:hypothetical protein
MIDKGALCEKIRALYPDVGECEIDVQVDYDEEQQMWVVKLKKDNHRLKTYLESEDADLCMAGKQCVGLGLQIAQLRSNIEKI